MNYDYTNKFTRKSASELIVPLPAIYNSDTKEYEPDWDYMEEFIKQKQATIQAKVRSLTTWAIF